MVWLELISTLAFFLSFDISAETPFSLSGFLMQASLAEMLIEEFIQSMELN